MNARYSYMHGKKASVNSIGAVELWKEITSHSHSLGSLSNPPIIWMLPLVALRRNVILKAKISKSNLKEIFSNQTLNNYDNKTSNQRGKPKGMIQHETVVDANISRDFNEKMKEFRERTNLDDLKSSTNIRNKFHKGQGYLDHCLNRAINLELTEVHY